MRALYKRIGFQIEYAAKAKSTYDIPVAYVIYIYWFYSTLTT